MKIKRQRYPEETLEYEKNRRIRKKKKAKQSKNGRKWLLENRLKDRLRSRLYQAIKLRHAKKQNSHIKDLGCTIEELITYLESKWKPGMNWDNWAVKGWHIDHIYPLSKINWKDKEDIKRYLHYTNLQPLWYYENISKGDKI